MCLYRHIVYDKRPTTIEHTQLIPVSFHSASRMLVCCPILPTYLRAVHPTISGLSFLHHIHRISSKGPTKATCSPIRIVQSPFNFVPQHIQDGRSKCPFRQREARSHCHWQSQESSVSSVSTDALTLRSLACRYLNGSTIAILHKEEANDTQTEVCDSISAILVKALWPGCKLGEGAYGRAVLFEYPANGEAVMHVFAWLKASVEQGLYQNLDNITWRRNVLLPRMKEAARIMEIQKLTEIVEAAMASDIPDAAETVQH